MDRYEDILHTYWGYPSFRGIQRQIIESIATGHDTLGLMPTGGGKSLTFQVPALAMEGVCIVITPLIALMKDQVIHLRERGIKAAAVHADLSRQEIITILENCIFGGIKLLYISPERLASELFLAKLKHMRVSFITVDEAHCISQWGYDFRPHYLHIAEVRKWKPNVPVLALTATATPQVVADIQEKLHFANGQVFQMSFERSNLAYIVRRTNNKDIEMLKILQTMKSCAIVYVRSRKATQELAKYLCQHGFTATFFHAGLEAAVKDAHQQAWLQGNKQIMVATNAFGMGIDKPDVRIVIHYNCPDSIEAYFQEAGRAGRDGKKAYAVLLYGPYDKRTQKMHLRTAFPPKDAIRKVYEHLAYFYQIGVGSGAGHTFPFHLEQFCHTYHFEPRATEAALRILQRAGYIDYEHDPDAAARLFIPLTRNDLYKLDSLSPREDSIMTTLMRNYGTLFSDYTYINEERIAQQCNISVHELYQALISLSQRRIVNFIPQRKTPFISYLRHRVEERHVVLPKEVYEDRKEQMQQHVMAMLTYAEEDGVCRSRQLLRYFGEERANDCRMCDVCLKDKAKVTSQTVVNDAIWRIKALLSDDKPHAVQEILALPILPKVRDEVMRSLADDEVIEVNDGFISLAKS